MNTKSITFLVVALVLFAGLFVLMKPKEKSLENLGQVNTPLQPAEKTFEFIVKEGKVVSGPDVMKVTEGDMVKIKVTVDEDEELHLHGYDLETELKKDIPSELNFVANLTGRFNLELHESDLGLSVMEVLPK